jgi:hypothetical protein
VVTESNLRAVILGEGKGFSKTDLRAMDLNQDGVVDVADLIFYVRSLPPRPNGVNFEATTRVVKEGDGAVSLTVTVSPTYRGAISYVVEGTATSGVDYAVLSGSIAVNGGTAALDITLVDDLVLEEVESLTITLIPDVGYRIGFAQQHTMFIVDNDAIWEGSLGVDGLNIGFTMELKRSGANYQAWIHSDGSTGLPTGTWPVTLNATETSFRAVLGPFPVQPEDTLLRASLERRIVLTARQSNEAHLIDYDKAINGDMTETFTAPGGAVQFERLKGRAIQGVFLLLKEIAVVPVADSGLRDIP